ncbi:MAG: twin-arginine translocase TatA/TatE family subunit [Candidatus Komeilibacteria bacterium]|jgi:sec-independent protein translocase protein TatA|nr:twin-arginine translocase TatA/TatE family subunit [Candidatus Komeilibacteria bacterium]MBT4447127.1 twin-arginine translocase TatA/TatE family subunit [Candidatus Komeilibacteria bacterium]
MFGLGAKELIIIAAVIVLLFGSKKIPELAEGIAQGIRNLRGGFKNDDSVRSVDEAKSADSTDEKKV